MIACPRCESSDFDNVGDGARVRCKACSLEWEPLSEEVRTLVLYDGTGGWTFGVRSTAGEDGGNGPEEYGASARAGGDLAFVSASGDLSVETGPAGLTVPFGVLRHLLAIRGFVVIEPGVDPATRERGHGQ